MEPSFILLLIVVCWTLLLVTEFVTVCYLWPSLTYCAMTDGRVVELMNTVLASALAYAAGKTNRRG